jgi:RHS repeat-associated protein
MRPERLTDAAGATVWRALYQPFGAVHQITGPASLDLRFPGQWFQLETGLHYNWHRHYDPTTGRYTQPDPLGLAALLSDGPSVYAYAGQSPLMWTDPEGLQSRRFPNPWPMTPRPAGPAYPGYPTYPGARPRAPEQQFADWIWKQCQRVGKYFGGGDPRRDDPECEKEWEEAEEICRQEREKPRHMRNVRLTGGYPDIERCARGLVSERCGGNPVDRR